MTKAEQLLARRVADEIVRAVALLGEDAASAAVATVRPLWRTEKTWAGKKAILRAAVARALEKRAKP